MLEYTTEGIKGLFYWFQEIVGGFIATFGVQHTIARLNVRFSDVDAFLPRSSRSLLVQACSLRYRLKCRAPWYHEFAAGLVRVSRARRSTRHKFFHMFRFARRGSRSWSEASPPLR
jgi:hypothetical protein